MFFKLWVRAPRITIASFAEVNGKAPERRVPTPSRENRTRIRREASQTPQRGPRRNQPFFIIGCGVRTRPCALQQEIAKSEYVWSSGRECRPVQIARNRNRIFHSIAIQHGRQSEQRSRGTSRTLRRAVTHTVAILAKICRSQRHMLHRRGSHGFTCVV